MGNRPTGQSGKKRSVGRSGAVQGVDPGLAIGRHKFPLIRAGLGATEQILSPGPTPHLPDKECAPVAQVAFEAFWL